MVVNLVVVPLVVAAMFTLLPADQAVRLGVLLVLLCPCVDYVIVFSGLASGSNRGQAALRCQCLQYGPGPVPAGRRPGGDGAHRRVGEGPGQGEQGNLAPKLRLQHRRVGRLLQLLVQLAFPRRRPAGPGPVAGPTTGA